MYRSFKMVYKFLVRQTDRPFLKRYLKRDEILRQIAACDTSLSDSVNTFSVSLVVPPFDLIRPLMLIYHQFMAAVHPDSYLETSPSPQLQYNIPFGYRRRWWGSRTPTLRHPRRIHIHRHLHAHTRLPKHPIQPRRNPRKAARFPPEAKRA